MTSPEDLAVQLQEHPDRQDLAAELWRQNRRQVKAIVRRYAWGCDTEDLEQEAFLGLMEAVQRYDPERGPFFPCLAQAVRARLSKVIARSGAVQIPQGAYWKRRKLRRILDSGTKLSREELAEETGIPRSEVDFLLSDCLSAALSLDAPTEAAGGESEGLTLGNLLPVGDLPEVDVIDGVFLAELRGALREVIDSLPYELSHVIRERFFYERTLEEIGADLGITGTAAGQKISRALQLMGSGEARKRLLPFWEELREAEEPQTREDCPGPCWDFRTEALMGSGAGMFRRTWTSSTERAALFLVERRIQQDGV